MDLTENIIIYHMIAVIIGYVLDLIIGDPLWMPHPVRLIGKLIYAMDHRLMDGRSADLPDGNSGRSGKRRDPSEEFRLGTLMWITVVAATVIISTVILVGSYKICVPLGVAVEAVMTCYLLAAKSLKTESTRVQLALERGSIGDARRAVSMIVGRDTKSLDAAGVTRAAVETVAENTSDGVTAPLIYTCIGGPVLGWIYKAVNTMDSMVGYHNDRYEYFGRFAARMDDVFNFIPSRIAGVCMVIAAAVGGREFSGRGALRIFLRDRSKHKSPNSAQTESACAGALGLRLAGDASYFGGVVKKPYIGDPVREIEPGDISRANRLMFTTEAIVLVICLAGMIAVIIC